MPHAHDGLKSSAPVRTENAVVRLVDNITLSVAVAIAMALVFAWLGGDLLIGDEHNAIYFLKVGLWDYVRTFHYGHLLKIQFWMLHEFFGNSFFWYRMPAALASAAFIAWLACAGTHGSPDDRLGRALAILFVVSNVQFLYFARWGMPNYAESILLVALLLSVLLPETIAGLVPRWTAPRLALIFLLPWVYPATLILLGAVSAYFGLRAMLGAIASRDLDARGLGRKLLRSAVPLLLGVVSFLAYRMTVPDAQWERARGHHVAFKSWVAAGHGGAVSFVLDSFSSIGKELFALQVHGKYGAWSSMAYLVLGSVLLIATLVALALVAIRAVQKKRALPLPEQGFLRGGWFLASVLLISLAVAVGGSLFDVFPAIGMRHLFFMVPVMAFLFVLSIGYLSAMAGQFAPAGALGRISTAAVVMLFGGLVAFAVLQQRRESHLQMDQLTELFHSPKNDIIFSYAPGFFVSKATVPNQQPYFMTDAGSEIPGSVIQAIREKAAAATGGRIAILSRASTLGSDDSALNDVIKDYSLQLVESVEAGNHTVLVFHIPHGAIKSVVRTVDLTVQLPTTPIAAVRLDPTQFRQSTLTIGAMEMIDAGGRHPIDLCGDRKLTLVRSLRIGGASKCSFIMGNSSNAGWLAPGELHGLPASTGPRMLHIRMTGEFSGEIKVYVDEGAGYSNAIREKVADLVVDAPMQSSP